MTEPTFEEDVAAYVELDARRADIQIKLDEIKARLRERGLGKYDGPNGIVVNVTANRRFSADKAAEVLPDELISMVQTTSVDAKLAKAKLPPDTYDMCKIEVGEPRVTVR